MEKTITIGSAKVRLSNNVGWTLAYRDQFGRDIIPAIMPALWSLTDIMAGLMQEIDLDGQRNVSAEEIVKALSGDTVTDAFIKLSGLEFVDFVNIVWAMAKAADESIDDPREWVRQFDEFPIDVIGPAVLDLVVKGMISSKNVERLRSLIEKLMPEPMKESRQTQSSSPALSEG